MKEVFVLNGNKNDTFLTPKRLGRVKIHLSKALGPLNRLNMGLLNIEATSAVIIKATNKRSSMSPASLAMVASIICMAPLAFMSKPIASDSLRHLNDHKAKRYSNYPAQTCNNKNCQHQGQVR